MVQYSEGIQRSGDEQGVGDVTFQDAICTTVLRTCACLMCCDEMRYISALKQVMGFIRSTCIPRMGIAYSLGRIYLQRVRAGYMICSSFTCYEGAVNTTYISWHSGERLVKAKGLPSWAVVNYMAG